LAALHTTEVLHRVLTWLGIGINIKKMKRTKAVAVDSSLRLRSIFAQTLGKASPSITVKNMLTRTFSQANLDMMAIRAVL
jgi:hypothetical protein